MLKQVAKQVVHALNITRAFRAINRGNLRILMYHRFPADTRGLEKQCAHISRYYRPISLAEVAEILRTGDSLPPNAVAVTIDDGFRDFLTHAHPVFRAHNITPTVYLVSDFIDGALWFWWNKLDHALATTHHTSLVFETPNGTPHRSSFATDAKRQQAFDSIGSILVATREPERTLLLNTILDKLEVASLLHPPPEHAPLTWNDVRQLSNDNVEFGAHTKTHPILSQVTHRETLYDEIALPKKRIEAQINREVIHFCYPNGRREDFTDEATEIVRDCGYRTAVTTERGFNAAGAQPFLLRRIGAEPNAPPLYFQEILAGLRRS